MTIYFLLLCVIFVFLSLALLYVIIFPVYSVPPFPKHFKEYLPSNFEYSDEDCLIRKLFVHAREQPNRIAFYSRDKTQEKGNITSWKGTTWSQYAQLVRTAAHSLLRLGIHPKMNFCILSSNRPEWVIFHLAAMTIQCVCAGIYHTSSPKQVAYILEHSDCKVLLIESYDQFLKSVKDQWEVNQAIKNNLQLVIILEEDDRINEHNRINMTSNLKLVTWKQFMESSVDQTELDDKLDGLVRQIKLDDICTFIYTSGTTGNQKCVMLSYKNIAAQVKTQSEGLGFVQQDKRDIVMINYLPLVHVAEQTFSVYLAVSLGYQLYFAASIESMPRDILTARPTAFFGVPRTWEKMANSIQSQISEKNIWHRWLIRWARMNILRSNGIKFRHASVPKFLQFKCHLLTKYVLPDVRTQFGLDRCTSFFTGAAPISPNLIQFFASFGITVQEIYGQSENAGMTVAPRRDYLMFGHSGIILPGFKLKIAPDDEILVGGDGVFVGYYKDTQATIEAIDDEGYLRTGDLGELSPEGFLRVTGRKKDLIKTSNAKFVAPSPIETSLCKDNLINGAVVIGEGRKFLSCVISLDPDHLLRFVTEQNLEGCHHSNKSSVVKQFYRHPMVRSHIDSVIHQVNQDVSRAEQIKVWITLPRSFSIEEGEFTPTHKVKRQAVMNHFSRLIDEMYMN